MPKKSISDTKTTKSLDITTITKQSPGATTRPTILKHDKAVTDPMIKRHNSIEIDASKDEQASDDATSEYGNIGNNTDNDNNTDTTVSMETENISSLIDGKKYYIKVESPKTRMNMLWIVITAMLVIASLVVFSIIY